jgi:hypothetical protein
MNKSKVYFINIFSIINTIEYYELCNQSWIRKEYYLIWRAIKKF